MSKTFKIVNDDISDGYHTFDELYEHRYLLYINLVLAYGNGILKLDHWDGWDCIYLETAYGQISYHVPTTMRPLYKDKLREDKDYKYDGHSSQDTVVRLRNLAGVL